MDIQFIHGRIFHTGITGEAALDPVMHYATHSRHMHSTFPFIHCHVSQGTHFEKFRQHPDYVLCFQTWSNQDVWQESWGRERSGEVSFHHKPGMVLTAMMGRH